MRRAAVTLPQLSGSSCTQGGTSVTTENPRGTSVTTENPSAAPFITWLPYRAQDPRDKKEKKV